uniref:SGNH hydrolase-type esterase domain-containing protein n=1 Tax=viral metagenome TaxID=1070528 RepID=A0A6C0DJG7_9ZZZZ
MEDKFCLIGNSHTTQFDNPNMNILYGYGASICGLYNENSVLKLKQQILDYQNQNQDKTLIFFLGQSDIEFIYYYKSIKNSKKLLIDEFIVSCVDKYIEFVKTYINNPIILGINPTVIKSNEHIFNVNFREISNYNPAGSNLLNINYDDVKDYYDNFKIRFDNNLKFNKILKCECEKNNIIYVDLNDEILNEDMSVNEKYIPTYEDHHIVKNISLYNTLINKIKNYI